MDCKAPVTIYLCLSSHSAGLLGFDTAREVRLNNMLGERQRHGGARDRKRGSWEKERKKKKWREREKEREDRWEVTWDGQSEGKRQPQCLVVGVWKKEAKHWEEKREWSDVRKQLGLTSYSNAKLPGLLADFSKSVWKFAYKGICTVHRGTLYIPLCLLLQCHNMHHLIFDYKTIWLNTYITTLLTCHEYNWMLIHRGQEKWN